VAALLAELVLVDGCAVTQLIILKKSSSSNTYFQLVHLTYNCKSRLYLSSLW